MEHRIAGGEEDKELTGQDIGRIIYVDIKIQKQCQKRFWRE